MPHYEIRIDQTEKIQRTVERMKGQQKDLMEIQAKFNGGAHRAAQVLRLSAFSDVLSELEDELQRLRINKACDAAGKSLELKES